MRRRIREVVRQTPVRSGWDLLFIARAAAAEAGFAALQEAVLSVERRASVLAGSPIPETQKPIPEAQKKDV